MNLIHGERLLHRVRLADVLLVLLVHLLVVLVEVLVLVVRVVHLHLHRLVLLVCLLLRRYLWPCCRPRLCLE